jgi:large subunit ribosomal protein L20
MSRVKSSVPSRAYRKSVLKRASGFRGRSNNVYTVAKQKVDKAGQYAYRDRHNKKRDCKGLMITRVNAICRFYGITYSEFSHKLKLVGIFLNLKVLENLASQQPHTFGRLVETIYSAE